MILQFINPVSVNLACTLILRSVIGCCRLKSQFGFNCVDQAVACGFASVACRFVSVACSFCERLPHRPLLIWKLLGSAAGGYVCSCISPCSVMSDLLINAYKISAEACAYSPECICSISHTHSDQ